LYQAIATPENHWAPIAVAATLALPAPRSPVELVEHTQLGDCELIRYLTRASRLEVCIAARTIVTGGGHAPLELRRCFSIFTSRDGGDPRAAALAHVAAHDPAAMAPLFTAHEQRWQQFWSRADVRVSGSPATEQALRFGSYHLRIAADEDPRVSVPARALSGRAYEGHVFWDAEIFMLPFYLHVAPVLARNLLLYRHHTLDGARQRAQRLGYRGALFAWESTVTGEDVTPTEIVLKSSGQRIPIFTGQQQVHISADIAYAVWRYFQATHDEAFIAGPGAELLFETARFWMSRVTRNGRQQHIRGVVGPDEYHHDVDDNAYTSWMARFNLERAAEVGGWLVKRARVPLLADEPQQWAELAATLYCPAPGPDGVIEQFAGFFALDDYPLSDGELFRAPVSRLMDWDKINRKKLIKQADVLMLPFLFPEAFCDAIVAANYHYYEPRTDHGSSLSPPVHATIAARLGLRDDAEHYWNRSLWLDLSNAMDNSALGVHPATMGGTWQALVRGWLGVRFADSGPIVDARLATRLPAVFDAVAMQLMWRGREHAIGITRAASHDAADATAPEEKPAAIEVRRE
jgi:trehalose/maltose hydrolase-like predicted phosphorylase